MRALTLSVSTRPVPFRPLMVPPTLRVGGAPLLLELEELLPDELLDELLLEDPAPLDELLVEEPTPPEELEDELLLEELLDELLLEELLDELLLEELLLGELTVSDELPPPQPTIVRLAHIARARFRVDNRLRLSG